MRSSRKSLTDVYVSTVRAQNPSAFIFLMIYEADPVRATNSAYCSNCSLVTFNLKVLMGRLLSTHFLI